MNSQIIQILQILKDYGIDKHFFKQALIIAHNNPKAHVSTSLKTHLDYSLESAYLGLNFFWAQNPAENDFLLFEFFKPTKISK